MPQMLPIQPVSPKAQPKSAAPKASEKKDQTQFSSHLDNALSRKKADQASAPAKSSNGGKDKSSSTGADAVSNDENQKLTTSPKNKELDTNTEESQEPSLATDPTQQTVDSQVSETQQNGTSTNPLQLLLEGSANTAGKGFGNLETTTETADNNIAGFKIQSELSTTPVVSKQSTTPAVFEQSTTPTIEDSTNPLPGNKQDALISQLQKIIDNSNETGTVSITKAESSAKDNSIKGDTASAIAATTSSETAAANLTGLAVRDLDGIDKSTGKPTHHLNGNKQDLQQQYFNAKINPQNQGENQQNHGDQQGDQLSQQNTGSGLQSGPFTISEQTNTFSQVSAIVQNTPIQQANESTQPIILPSGTVVNEDEVIQQLTERFQISGKQTDSKINIKLHPAELGELKINLSVKEGSIRASVVAQSQHTLEILEKNIPKLKTVLENQGFTVDEISVTAESDSVGSFDLFDRQLFSNNDNTPPPQKGRRRDDSAFVLEGNEYLSSTSNNSLNVTI